MPSISEFFGITIYMYHAHGKHKAAYFHARYQGSDASLEVDSGIVLAGNLPPKVLKVIQEWRVRHRQELLENWERVKLHELPQYIQGADHD
jgi:hypothetical protein